MHVNKITSKIYALWFQYRNKLIKYLEILHFPSLNTLQSFGNKRNNVNIPLRYGENRNHKTGHDFWIVLYIWVNALRAYLLSYRSLWYHECHEKNRLREHTSHLCLSYIPILFFEKKKKVFFLLISWFRVV